MTQSTLLNWFLAWQPDTEYRFDVNSKTLTALKGITEEGTGVFIRAQLLVQPKTQEHLTARLIDVLYAQAQNQVPEEEYVQNDRLVWKELDLEYPFEIKMNKGLVSLELE